MRAGDTVGSVRIVAIAATRDGVERYRVVDAATGDPAELLVYVGTDGESRRRFARAHEALGKANHPGVVRTRSVKVESARALVVRDPLEDETLERLAGPADGPVVAAVTESVGRAVLASGGVLGGLFRPEDVGVSATGSPILAPRFGPVTNLERSAIQAAPERAPTDVAALFVLGTLTWRWVTGRTWSRGQRATVIRPGIDPGWDDVFALLLADDPSRRPAALDALRPLRAEVVDLRPVLRAVPAQLPVRVTRSEAPPPRVVVYLPAAAVEALAAPARSRLAGSAGLPDRVVDELVGRQLPIVLDGASSWRAAQKKAGELATRLGVEPAVAAPGLLSGAWPRLAGAGAVAATLLAAAGLAVLGLVPVAWAFFVVAVLGAGATELVARGWERSRREHAVALESRRHARAALEDRSADGRLDAAWKAIADLKVQLATSAVPATAAADVRALLRSLERELEDVAAGGRAVALPNVPDRATLEARIRALDGQPDRVAERALLVDTLRDLDALVARRADLRGAAQRVVDRAARLSVAVARIGGPDDEADLDALARLVRDGA